jgi:hypothetical protein
MGDAITGGATNTLREAMGINATVDHNSAVYASGKVTGTVVDAAITATGVGGAVKAIAKEGIKQGVKAGVKEGAKRVGAVAAGYVAGAAGEKVTDVVADAAVESGAITQEEADTARAIASVGSKVAGYAGLAKGAKPNTKTKVDKVKNPKKQAGSYTITHKSGKKYHGKGPKSRAYESGRQKAKDYDDPVEDVDWTPAKNDREAFKDEARRIRNDGGKTSDSNYNKINSPGEKYLQQDED